jgi:leader peptidase (prepilin peptidase) / N-methyltransferase
LVSSPSLQILSTLGGLLAGTVIVFLAPRLVAYRLSQRVPLPPTRVLIPLVGAWWGRWRPVYSSGLEILSAGVFLALSIRYGSDIKLLVGALYSTLLLTIAAIDLDHRLVLNRLSYPGVVLALIGSLLWPGIGLVSALLGAVVGLGIFLVLQVLGRGSLGVGDMKLALLIGAMRGFPDVFNALLLGTLLGGLAAAFLLIVMRKGRKASIAYGPYLAAGAILSFFV